MALPSHNPHPAHIVITRSITNEREANAILGIPAEPPTVDAPPVLCTQLHNSEGLPLFTDGSTLQHWKTQMAQARAKTGQCRIVVTGDSWAESMRTSPKLRQALLDEHGQAGYGWASVSGLYLDTLRQDRTGSWQLAYNSTAVPGTSPPVGCGPDGYALSSNTPHATISLSNIPNSNQAVIFLARTNGEIRYQEENGEWFNYVINPQAEAVQAIPLTLSSNKLNLELLSGSVTVLGFYFSNTTATGCEYSKIAHAGATGFDYSMHTATWTPFFANYLKPDLVVVILGTNDYWMAHGNIQTHKQALRDIVAAYRSGSPHCGFVFVSPARSIGPGHTTQAKFRDAMFEVAHDVGAEVYNMHDHWEAFSVENANGQWADVLHLSHDLGTSRFVSALVNQFLKD